MQYLLKQLLFAALTGFVLMASLSSASAAAARVTSSAPQSIVSAKHPSLKSVRQVRREIRRITSKQLDFSNRGRMAIICLAIALVASILAALPLGWGFSWLFWAVSSIAWVGFVIFGILWLLEHI
jgi:hypothetical protein